MAASDLLNDSVSRRSASLVKALDGELKSSEDKIGRRMVRHKSLPTLRNDNDINVTDRSRRRSAAQFKLLLPPLDRIPSVLSEASPAASQRSIASTSTRAPSTTSSSSRRSSGSASLPSTSTTQAMLANVGLSPELQQQIDKLCVGGEDVGDRLQHMLDTVFSKLTAKELTGLMRFRQWQIATRFLDENPVLRGRAQASDVDRLFYAQTHKKTVRCGITRREFVPLLQELSQAMDVPASLVLFCIGSQAEFLDTATEQPQPIKRSASVTVKRKLPTLPRNRTV